MMLLQVEGLVKRFGGVTAARDVTFAVDTGRMVAIIGPNGAGKSTIFNMVGGQLAPDAGTVRLAGQPITGLGARDIWRRGVGRTFQIAQTFVSMTVIENVQMALISAAGHSRSLEGAARDRHVAEARALLGQVGLEPLGPSPVATLAYGDVKRLELAVALASSPKLLLMDEPTAGMAPKERNGLMALVARLAREHGIGVLFTEHDMDAVFGHADLILVLVRGEIIARGSAAEIRANARVKEVYLGDMDSLAAAKAKRLAQGAA
jgi:branched-chain amino acid transport system ATP-binding protein